MTCIIELEQMVITLQTLQRQISRPILKLYSIQKFETMLNYEMRLLTASTRLTSLWMWVSEGCHRLPKLRKQTISQSCQTETMKLKHCKKHHHRRKTTIEALAKNQVPQQMMVEQRRSLPQQQIEVVQDHPTRTTSLVVQNTVPQHPKKIQEMVSTCNTTINNYPYNKTICNRSLIFNSTTIRYAYYQCNR